MSDISSFDDHSDSDCMDDSKEIFFGDFDSNYMSMISSSVPKFCHLGSPAEFFYSYLKSCYSFSYSTVDDIIEVARSVHICYIDIIYRLGCLGWEPIPEIVDQYFHIRHDLFSALCKTLIGCDNVSLETDVCLGNYGIDSDRTPDFVHLKEGKMMIIEFTVTSKRSSAEEQKGTISGGFKYMSEVNALNLKGVAASVVIIPLILSEYNTDEVLQILQKNFCDEIDGKAIRNLANIFCSSLQYINNTRKFSTIIEADFGSVVNKISNMVSDKLDKMSRFPTPEPMKVIMINPSIYSNIFNSCRSIKKVIINIINSKKSDQLTLSNKICLVYDVSDDKVKVKYSSPWGNYIEINKWLSILDDADIKKLITNITFVNRDKIASLSDYSGSLPVSMDIKNKDAINSPIPRRLIYDSLIRPYTSDDIIEDTPCLTYNRLRTEELKVMFDKDYYYNLVKSLNHGKIAELCEDNLIGNHECNENNMSNSISTFDEKYIEVNGTPHIIKPKKTFVIPFASGLIYGNYLNIDTIFLKKIIKNIPGLYTKKALQMFIDGKVVKSMIGEVDEKINKLRVNYNKCNTDYFDEAKEIIGSYKIPSWKDIEKKATIKLKFLKKTLDKNRNLYLSTLKKRSMKAAINMVKIKRNDNTEFKDELKHYCKGVRKGVGMAYDSEYSRIDNFFLWFMEFMFELESNNINEELYSRERGPGPQYLTDLKNWHTDRFDECSNFFAKTKLGWACEFAGRLGHSLMKESCKSYNKNYIKIDNLGYTNVLIIIRGGPKIYRGQESKMYRLIYPIKDIPFKYLGMGVSTDYNVFVVDDVEYVATPWEKLRQDIICDLMTILRRVFFHLYIYSERSKNNFSELPKDALFPVLLAFHNRRKTEELVHNTRYLIVNQLGSYSSMKEMVGDFATFNHTYLDMWLKKKISKNFSSLSKSLDEFKNISSKSAIKALMSSNLKHIWTGDPIKTLISFTNLIYSTYLMTKAPINQSVEQANNLKNVLNDVNLFHSNHDSVNGLDDLTLRRSIDDYTSNPYKDDFNYDPKYCQYMGYYMSNIIGTNIGVTEIHNKWRQICSYEADYIANSRGLRGSKNNDFFGEKGYEVVYTELTEKYSIDEMKESINFYKNDDDQYNVANLVKSDKYSIEEIIRDCNIEDFIFHIVPKIQRAGPREIYAMDMKTKCVQNPIEKFIGWICSKLPNESISVASNYRHQDVHSSFFEKNPGSWVTVVMRWVLDCRRWGPHSIFQKYVHFIRGMEHILPKSFVKLFYYASHMMFNKKIFTKKSIVNILENNSNLTKQCSFLRRSSKITDGYYFEMKFSFVMGIFNYLSSFMHSANQLLAEEIIRDYCLYNSLGLCVINMKAHSDDSAGKSFHSKKESIQPSVILYDWLLKAANHMLSVKKSVINNDIYFEFLSVLYLKDRLLPMISKFVSIPFKPTDQGYSADISFAAAQSLEILTYGGTIEESFLLMKLTEKFIQRFYGINPSYSLPFCFLGGFDAYPIELILSGTDSEYIKHLRYNNSITCEVGMALDNKNLINKTESCDLTLKWDLGCRMKRSLYTKFEKYIDNIKQEFPEIWNSWTIKNMKLANCKLNIIWYLSKLNDSSFYSSLISEPVSRRIARSYSAANKKCLVDKDGKLISAKVIASMLKAIVDSKNKSDKGDIYETDPFFDVINEELTSFWITVSEMKFIPKFEPSTMSLKPLRISLGFPSLGSITLTPTMFVTIIKEPFMSGLLGIKRGNDYQVNAIKDKIGGMISLEDSTPYQLQKVVAKVLGRESISINMIGIVEPDNRNLNTMEGLFRYCLTNLISSERLITNLQPARQADVVRRFKESSIPPDVIELVNHFWANELLKRYKVNNRDIFIKLGPYQYLKESIKKVPFGWANMIETQARPLIKLKDCYYWKIWVKEQYKVSGSWVGSGDLLFRMPEIAARCSLSGAFFNKIIAFDTTEGYFSEASCWYFENIIMPDSSLSAQCISSDYVIRDDKYIGYNKFKSAWGFGNPSMFDVVLEATKNEYDYTEQIFEDNIKIETEGSDMFIRTPLRKYKVESLLSKQGSEGLNMKQYLSISKITKLIASNDKNIIDFVERCAVDYNKDIRFVNEEAFERNSVASKTYEVLSQSNYANGILNDPIHKSTKFFEALLEYKNRNPDFRFPTKQQIISIHKDTNSAPLPDKMISLLTKLGMEGLTTSQVNYIEQEMTRTNPNNVDKVYERISESFGVGIACESVVAFGHSDYRVLKGCGKLHLREKANSLFDTLITASIQCIQDGECDYSCFTNMGLVGGLTLNDLAIRNLKMIMSIALYDCDCFFNLSCDNLKSVRLAVDKICFMIDNGMLEYLQTNKRKLGNTDFATTNFDDAELCKNWVVDIFDSMCCLSNGLRGKKDNVRERIIKIRGLNKSLARSISTFHWSKKLSIKISYNRKIFKRNKKTLTVARITNTERPAFFNRKFCPISNVVREPFNDEINSGISLSESKQSLLRACDDWEIKGPIESTFEHQDPKILCKNIPNIDHFLKYAGTSEILIIESPVLPYNHKRLETGYSVWVKEKNFTIWDNVYYSTRFYIAIYPKSVKNLVLIGYKKLEVPDIDRSCNMKKVSNHKIKLDTGEFIDRDSDKCLTEITATMLTENPNIITDNEEKILRAVMPDYKDIVGVEDEIYFKCKRLIARSRKAKEAEKKKQETNGKMKRSGSSDSESTQRIESKKSVNRETKRQKINNGEMTQKANKEREKKRRRLRGREKEEKEKKRKEEGEEREEKKEMEEEEEKKDEGKREKGEEEGTEEEEEEEWSEEEEGEEGKEEKRREKEEEEEEEDKRKGEGNESNPDISINSNQSDNKLNIIKLFSDAMEKIRKSGGIKGSQSNIIKEAVKTRMGFFKVQDPIKLIRDPTMMAELNQCTGCNMESILRGEVFLDTRSISILNNVIDNFMAFDGEYNEIKNRIAKGFMMKFILGMVNLTNNVSNINNDFFRIVMQRFYIIGDNKIRRMGLPEPETRVRIEMDVNRWLET